MLAAARSRNILNIEYALPGGKIRRMSRRILNVFSSVFINLFVDILVIFIDATAIL
jgi:hypothetical protein